MRKTKTLIRSFAGGVMSPELYGRTDLVKYGSGLTSSRNWVLTPQGAMHRRAGTEFIGWPNRNDPRGPRLVSFIANDEQAFILEFTHQAIRFFFDGQQVLDGGSNPLTVVTGYDQDQVHELQIVQSNDVLTIVHPDHPVRLLTRVNSTTWTLEDEKFYAHNTGGAEDRIDPPAITVTVNETTTGAPIRHRFVATEFDPISGAESLPGPAINVELDFTQQGNTVDVFTVATGARSVRIYKDENNGLYGLVAEEAVLGNSFNIRIGNIAPDYGRTPPEHLTEFDQVDERPGAVGYWGQRKVLAATNARPQTYWMTETGTEAGMNYHIPSQATDAIQYTVASRYHNAIRHMVAQRDLYLFTNGDVWRVRANDGVVTPDSLVSEPMAGVGASVVPPVATQNTVLFVAERGQTVRELNPLEQINSDYAVRNLSILAGHLFRDHSLLDLEMIESPDPVIVALRDDGRLLCATYMPEEQVLGWFELDLGDDGAGSIAVIPEGLRDSLYVSVRRNDQWYIERLRFDLVNDLAGDVWFPDAQLVYEGAAANVITGLDHLNGRSDVFIVDQDGYQRGPFPVAGGSMTITDAPVTRAFVGLMQTADCTLLPVVVGQLPDMGLASMLNVRDLTLLVRHTIGLVVNTSDSTVTDGVVNEADVQALTGNQQAVSTTIKAPVRDSWSISDELTVRQNYLLPAQILAMSATVGVGDGY